MRQGPTVAMIVLLLVQFVLGMATNLYVTIPAHHAGADPANYLTGSAQSVGWAISSGGTVLAAHAVLGFLLVLAALHVLGAAVVTHRRAPLLCALLGGGFIIGAGFNGASFLDFNHGTSSMIMALLFALATLAYVALLALDGSGGRER